MSIVFYLERTNQLSLLPDKDLVDLCPPIEPYQVTKNPIVQFNLLSGKLAEHLFADKIESYFMEHQLDYTGAVIYEVVLADQAMAEELYESIQEEEISFQEVAHRYIEDVELRRKKPKKEWVI